MLKLDRSGMRAEANVHSRTLRGAMPHRGYRLLLHRYRRYAPDYDRHYARYSDGTLARALALTPDIDGDLLDVACGTGLFEANLRQRRPRLRITGVDISPEMLANARRRFAGDDRVQFLQGTAEQLSVESNSFDIISCNNAFHLVQDASAALREFHRVLRAQGTLIIIDWCRNAPQMALMTAGQRLLDRQTRHVRGVREMRVLLAEHRFDVQRCERFRVRPMWGLMAFSALRRD